MRPQLYPCGTQHVKLCPTEKDLLMSTVFPVYLLIQSFLWYLPHSMLPFYAIACNVTPNQVHMWTNWLLAVLQKLPQCLLILGLYFDFGLYKAFLPNIILGGEWNGPWEAL